MVSGQKRLTSCREKLWTYRACWPFAKTFAKHRRGFRDCRFLNKLDFNDGETTGCIRINKLKRELLQNPTAVQSGRVVGISERSLVQMSEVLEVLASAAPFLEVD